ncbi:MAG: cyclopropane-fatty-acyl-phospholipid synthase family protein [Candidatus Tectimicrobiota bacterium]
MHDSRETLVARLRNDHFPRSATYDPQWVLDNQMGPHVLWLTEALIQAMPLRPGMRVLDLGCGRALSSIFLARECGVQVWATDLWIAASDNWQRIGAAGMAEQVFPIWAEAHALPFAETFFDAIVSVDAYHYFGTADLYIGYLSAFLKPEGVIGIVVPGLREELAGAPPTHLQACWEWDFCTFHSPHWWRRHWEKTGKVVVDVADMLPEGWRHWLQWEAVQADAAAAQRWTEMLRQDAGQHLGFVRLVAHRPPEVPQTAHGAGR